VAKLRNEKTEYHSDSRLESALRAATSEIGDTSIGRLSEKLLHRTLKHYLEPNTDCHEVECLGSVADIKGEGGIIEIQTRSFSRLKGKLSRFLESYPVTVVYPIVTDRLVEWCNPASGEITEVKKSPKKGRASDILYELSALSELVGREGLSFLLVFVKVREVRLLDGYGKNNRKRATKVNIIPEAISAPQRISTLEDVASLLPESLSGRFTARDFSLALRLKGVRASITLHSLLKLGIIERAGEEGRAYLYRKSSLG
jgi:hypothetical protein